jgi:hypothetical protein
MKPFKLNVFASTLAEQRAWRVITESLSGFRMNGPLKSAQFRLLISSLLFMCRFKGRKEFYSKTAESVIATVTKGLPDGWLKRLFVYPSGPNVGHVYCSLTIDYCGRRFHLK